MSRSVPVEGESRIENIVKLIQTTKYLDLGYAFNWHRYRIVSYHSICQHLRMVRISACILGSKYIYFACIRSRVLFIIIELRIYTFKLKYTRNIIWVQLFWKSNHYIISNQQLRLLYRYQTKHWTKSYQRLVSSIELWNSRSGIDELNNNKKKNQFFSNRIIESRTVIKPIFWKTLNLILFQMIWTLLNNWLLISRRWRANDILYCEKKYKKKLINFLSICSSLNLFLPSLPFILHQFNLEFSFSIWV